jgi:hypothetical protein
MNRPFVGIKSNAALELLSANLSLIRQLSK